MANQPTNGGIQDGDGAAEETARKGAASELAQPALKECPPSERGTRGTAWGAGDSQCGAGHRCPPSCPSLATGTLSLWLWAPREAQGGGCLSVFSCLHSVLGGWSEPGPRAVSTPLGPWGAQ